MKNERTQDFVVRGGDRLYSLWLAAPPRGSSLTFTTVLKDAHSWPTKKKADKAAKKWY